MSQHHYIFAHRALPEITFSDPERMIGLLATEHGAGFLAAIWKSVGERCNSNLPPQGLRHNVGRAGPGLIIACIELPPPEEPAEAYFVAIVAWLNPPDAKEPFQNIRFFALEKAAPIVPGVVTYLGEWTREGQHGNLGPGPEPGELAFVQAIFARIGASTA